VVVSKSLKNNKRQSISGHITNSIVSLLFQLVTKCREKDKILVSGIKIVQTVTKKTKCMMELGMRYFRAKGCLKDRKEKIAVFKDILRNWTQIEYLEDMELREKYKRPEGCPRLKMHIETLSNVKNLD
jgi:hypothetical protein